MANQPSKYSKFLIGAASAALVASAVAPVASAADFKDSKGTHEEAINALSDAGVISGYPDGTFLPNKTLSRSDVVKLMGKWLVAEGSVVPTDYKTNPRFSDLTSTSNDELLKFAAVVKDNGVFVGTPDGKLDPTGNITRENMAVVLVRAFDRVHEIDLTTYVAGQDFKKDVTDLGKAKAEARPAIEVLDFFDITNPAAPAFNPKSTTTRGQFATFLYKTTKTDFSKVTTGVVGSADIKAVNATTVEVTFKESVENLNSLDFKIDGLTVSNAAVKQTDDKVVVLTTAVQKGGEKYTVTLNEKAIGTFNGVSAVIPTTITMNTTSVQSKVGNQVILSAYIGVKEAGVPVTFNVDADNNSLNKDQVFEVVTNAEGIAEFSYTQYAAANDSVAVYPTGAPTVRGFATVYWGVNSILTLTSTTTDTVANGDAKTYSVTYLDQKTGEPIVNKVLSVTLAENIDADVTNDSTAFITDPATNATVKPFASSTDASALTIKTDSKGQATFTVTGSNTKATPIVFVDANENARVGATEIQEKAKTAAFTGASYTFEFNNETTVEGVINEGKKYTVTVKKADGTVYAGGTAAVDLFENIDNTLTTTTKSVFSTTGAVGTYNKDVKFLTLDAKGQASFYVTSDTINDSATPVVWVDINDSSNKNGVLETEESFKKAGSVVFRTEQVASAELSDESVAYGVYNINGSVKTADYTISLLNQAGNVYSGQAGLTRATYTLKNSGNSAVTLDLRAGNFDIDQVSNSTQVGNGSYTIAAGQSITVSGKVVGSSVTTVGGKEVNLLVTSEDAGSLSVTGSATYGVVNAARTGLSYTGNYAAGTVTSTWYKAPANQVEVTGTVVGYVTNDVATGAFGEVIVKTDTGTFVSFKYDSNNSYYVGTTSYSNLTNVNASDFEKAISIDDKISLKNGEIRLLNVDSSSKAGQIDGNAGGSTTPSSTVVTQAIADVINASTNVGQVKQALKGLSSFAALSDAEQTRIATAIGTTGTIRTVATLQGLYDTEYATSVANEFTANLAPVQAATTYAQLVAAVRNVPGAAASVTALEAETAPAVQAEILTNKASLTGANVTAFNTAVTTTIATAKTTVGQVPVANALAAVNAVTISTATSADSAVKAIIEANKTVLGYGVAWNSLTSAEQDIAATALNGATYVNDLALRNAINAEVTAAKLVSAVDTIQLTGGNLVITFTEDIDLTPAIAAGTVAAVAFSDGTGTPVIVNVTHATTEIAISSNTLTIDATSLVAGGLVLGNTITGITFGPAQLVTDNAYAKPVTTVTGVVAP